MPVRYATTGTREEGTVMGRSARAIVSVLFAPTLTLVIVMATPARPAGATDAVTVQSDLCYQPSRGTCVGGANHEFDAYLPSGITQKTPGSS